MEEGPLKEGRWWKATAMRNDKEHEIFFHADLDEVPEEGRLSIRWTTDQDDWEDMFGPLPDRDEGGATTIVGETWVEVGPPESREVVANENTTCASICFDWSKWADGNRMLPGTLDLYDFQHADEQSAGRAGVLAIRRDFAIVIDGVTSFAQKKAIAEGRDWRQAGEEIRERLFPSRSREES